MTEVPRHDVRMLIVDPVSRRVAGAAFADLPAYLDANDLVVVNDAATLPGSLAARTAAGEPLELRLVGALADRRASAIVFGAGDFRTRTEDRPLPPALAAGDELELVAWSDRDGPAAARARVAARSPVSPRWIELDLDGGADDAWRAIYRLGRPVQYAYQREPLPLWSVQTAYAARPWAAEMPSAGRPLTWELLLALRRRGVAIAALTHAAGLSSTGDPALDAALPWPERYEIPDATAAAVAAARRRGGRVVAVGTTVLRALESAATVEDESSRPIAGGVRAGAGTADLVITAAHRPRVADGLVTGVHGPEESHYRILASLLDRATLADATAAMIEGAYQPHELGDACLVLPGALAVTERRHRLA